MSLKDFYNRMQADPRTAYQRDRDAKAAASAAKAKAEAEVRHAADVAHAAKLGAELRERNARVAERREERSRPVNWGVEPFVKESYQRADPFYRAKQVTVVNFGYEARNVRFDEAFVGYARQHPEVEKVEIRVVDRTGGVFNTTRTRDQLDDVLAEYRRAV